MLAILLLMQAFLHVAQCLPSVSGDHFPMEKRVKCFRHQFRDRVVSDCNDLDLTKVPTNLNTDVQILDLSFNRIRELHSNSFSRYTDLLFLYLDDNMINYMDNDTFLPLQSLEVLSLSLNALTRIPSSIVLLPNLRKLNISHNRIAPDGLNTFVNAPLSNNLKQLFLVGCHLAQLPPLNNFLRMYELNISGNPLRSLGVLQLAPMCQLKDLDLGESYQLLSPCDCHILRQWAAQDEISVRPSVALSCTLSGADEENCHKSDTSLKMQELRSNCILQLQQQEHHAYTKKVWLYAGMIVAAVLGIIIVVSVWVYCRNRHNQRRLRGHSHFLDSGSNNKCNKSDKSSSDSNEACLLSPRARNSKISSYEK